MEAVSEISPSDYWSYQIKTDKNDFIDGQKDRINQTVQEFVFHNVIKAQPTWITQRLCKELNRITNSIVSDERVQNAAQHYAKSKRFGVKASRQNRTQKKVVRAIQNAALVDCDATLGEAKTARYNTGQDLLRYQIAEVFKAQIPHMAQFILERENKEKKDTFDEASGLLDRIVDLRSKEWLEEQQQIKEEEDLAKQEAENEAFFDARDEANANFSISN